MNIKDLIFPVTLALLTTILYQYHFSPDKTAVAEQVTNKRFVAPTSVQVTEPLDLSVSFYEDASAKASEKLSVTLPYGSMTFSPQGGVIDSIAYTREINGAPKLLVVQAPLQGKDQGAFLVALDGEGKTPYHYTLTDRKDLQDKTVLTFVGESPAARITKEFTIHHDSYVIEVTLTVDPKGEQAVRPRIFFPGLHIAEGTEVQNGVLMSGTYLEKSPVKNLLQAGVEQPTLFGLEDAYFAQVLYKDPEQFSQRAYFKETTSGFQAIVQGAAITEKKTWHLSFYSGPKEMASLSKVDPRLEELLSYGWLAPISKYMLYLLIFLYGLVHNYGIAIILITIFLRLLLIPFTIGAEKSRKKTMDAQKKLQYIEQRYKDNPEELSRAKQEFARKHGFPGAMGCLPLLLQAPVAIGLQRVLTHAVELYKAPFLWISDLSAPDPLYILPALVGITMAIQMGQMGDVRTRLVNVILAIVVAAIMASLSAGLTLFIAVTSLLALAQTEAQKAFAS